MAIDEACRDRLAFQNGITPDRIELLLNFVDLERFRPRAPLPPRPKRALVFSNYATDLVRALRGAALACSPAPEIENQLAEFAEMHRVSDAELRTLRATRAALENRLEEAERERNALRAELKAIRQVFTFRLRAWLFRSPKLVSLYQSLSGRHARSAREG